MADERVRLQIGFEGGTVMAVSVSQEGSDELLRHLSAGGNGTVTLDDEDGSFVVVIDHVLFVRRFARESRVGFGSGS
jgi:hypothetical protein